MEQGDRCFTGLAPSLYEVRQAYDRTTVETWLAVQLNDLSEFAGCREKLTEVQCEALAATIIHHFGFLKITEIMVLLQQFKAGKYGKFYGAVDGMVITEALHEFIRFRSDKLRRIEIAQRNERERMRAEERDRQLAAGELITHSEWQEIKWLYNQ